MKRFSVLVSLSAFGAAALGLATPALAQCTPPQTNNGPDVIVGDMHQIQNYTQDATYDAFSVGTYSCNIGTNWLNWIDSTNQHPVIGQGVYKLKTTGGVTTFEQIGQSWLKHGFFALSNNLCCTGCQGTDGTHLGVRCADPYSAVRNGSQGGLGPKYQVNATTGFFTFPPANPSWSGNVARRTAARLTDLENSSATVRYFASSIYICSSRPPVNAQDGQEPNANSFNNQSYRQLTYSGGNFAFTGTTQRTQAAIRAWGDFDTGVTEKEVLVTPDVDGIESPADEAGTTTNSGMFIVAAKAFDIGGGLWHYEYAVQNLNSHRSGQAFSIPVPEGVNVTNIGFHDVEYRNGDGLGNSNRSATDWTGTVAGGALTWATQTYAQNSNANALRWDTIYNFRFVADRAPVVGGATATITLFRAGASPTDPASVSVSGIPAPSAPPSFNIADLDQDGDVDIEDLAFMLSKFGTCDGEAGYDDSADIDDNNCIDIGDLSLLLANFGA